MSDTRADCWNHLMWLIVVVAGLSVAPLDKLNLPTIDHNIESVLVYFTTSVALLTHIHYGYGVVRVIRCIIEVEFHDNNTLIINFPFRCVKCAIISKYDVSK